MIRINCPKCSKTLGVSAEKKAAALKCPGCGHIFRMKSASAVEVEEEPDELPRDRPSAKTRPYAVKSEDEAADSDEDEGVYIDDEEVVEVPRKRKKRRPVDDEDEDEDERPFRRRFSSADEGFWEEHGKKKILPGLVLLCVGLGFFFYGKNEKSLTDQSSTAAEEVSLRALLARGERGNPHIVLKDFVPCQNIVCEHQEKGNQRWTKVWVPLLSIEEAARLQEKAPKSFPALFYSTKIRDQAELELRLSQPRFQGMLTSISVPLHSKERKLLQQSYPDTDLDRCFIIEEGRTPMSGGAIHMIMIGSGLAMLVGIGLIALGVFRYP